MEMADLLVSEGYAKAGYNLISLDDCWLDKERGSDGRLKPDPFRFPSGIPALADYVRRLISSKIIAAYHGFVNCFLTDTLSWLAIWNLRRLWKLYLCWLSGKIILMEKYI